MGWGDGGGVTDIGPRSRWPPPTPPQGLSGQASRAPSGAQALMWYDREKQEFLSKINECHV